MSVFAVRMMDSVKKHLCETMLGYGNGYIYKRSRSQQWSSVSTGYGQHGAAYSPELTLFLIK